MRRSNIQIAKEKELAKKQDYEQGRLEIWQKYTELIDKLKFIHKNNTLTLVSSIIQNSLLNLTPAMLNEWETSAEKSIIEFADEVDGLYESIIDLKEEIGNFLRPSIYENAMKIVNFEEMQSDMENIQVDCVMPESRIISDEIIYQFIDKEKYIIYNIFRHAESEAAWIYFLPKIRSSLYTNEKGPEGDNVNDLFLLDISEEYNKLFIV